MTLYRFRLQDLEIIMICDFTRQIIIVLLKVYTRTGIIQQNYILEI